MKETASKEIGSRIKELIFKLELNQTSFAKAVGVSHTAIFKTVSGETQPRLVLIDAIMKVYPQVNKDWLLEGKGEMFTNVVAEAKPDNYLQEHLRNLEENFQRLNQQLEVKDYQLEVKDQQIAAKDKQIERLMDLLGKPNDVIEGAQMKPLWGEKKQQAAS